MFYPFRRLFFYAGIMVPLGSFAQTVGNNTPLAESQSQSLTAKSVAGIQKSTRCKPRFVTNLSGTIKETSGLVFFSGQLWTINDSDNPAEMYQIDTIDGSVLRTIVIRNTVNTDWESITQDDLNIYIGDFGNNAGNRTDLHILKIQKAGLIDKTRDTLKAGYILFSYPDQTGFLPAFNNNNFDCEAFFYHNDSLHLFSKDWSDQMTRHYVLPADTGTYQARFMERFNAGGLVTDASINEKGNIVLLGYKNTGGKFYSCFTWLLSNYEGCYYFSGNKRRIELGSALRVGQAEGIFLKSDNTAWLSSESIRIGWDYRPAKLFRLDFSNY